MNSEQIKTALREKNCTLAIIADSLGVAANAVSQVIHRHSRSFNIANGIAIILEKPINEVFPDVPEYAEPNLSRTRNKAKRSARVTEVKNLLKAAGHFEQQQAMAS